MSDIVNRIAAFTLKTSYNSLPDNCAYYVKRAILDVIGCACAGQLTNRGRIAIEVSVKLGGDEDATIIGTPYKVSVGNAAFANGELINALDYDAMTDIGKHDVPIIVPAALAVAEDIAASGQDLITAIAVGLEISSRLNSGKDRIQVDTRKWPEVMGSSIASIAAAIAVGKLLDLDYEEMSNAIGISGYLCPPNTFRKWLEVSPVQMIKYGSSGWSAQAGVTAALLAQGGYTGDKEVFDGANGYWRFTGRSEPLDEEMLADLGQNWLWQKVNFKKYPAGGVLSGILNQFIDLISENNIKPNEVEKITACAPRIVGFGLFRENDLQTPDDYCFSAIYLLACAAHNINPFLWQREETRQDPNIKKFMQNVDLNVITDESPAKPLELIANGKEYIGKLSERRELDDELLKEKFAGNTSPYLSPKETETIIAQTLQLEKLTNVVKLMDLVSK